MLQPRNTSPVRKKNFSHNKHQSEDEQRRDETRAGGGGVWCLCGNRRGEPLLWRAWLFVSSCSRQEYRSNYHCTKKRLAGNSSDISIRCCCTLRIYIYYGDVQKSTLTRCWWVWLWWQTRGDFKVSRFGAETSNEWDQGPEQPDYITTQTALQCKQGWKTN